MTAPLLQDSPDNKTEDTIYGRCWNCNGLIVYFDRNRHRYFYVDGTEHTAAHQIDFRPDPLVEEFQVPPQPTASNTLAKMTSPPRVTQRITPAGYYYKLHGTENEIGLVTVDDEQDPEFDVQLGKKLGVEPKELLAARLYEIRRPTTFQEIAEVLSGTIRRDFANKLILFSAYLLTFTEEDQVNATMSGESSGGKSYTALEIASYFPQSIVRIIAGASPTAFFHDQGTWDNEQNVLKVDLKQKILIFLDQPHYTLMERLRPLLSHDRPELLYKITDKNKRGTLRTKNVLLIGYPTVVFCAAKFNLDEQERTRAFILSPETGQEKLAESILLKIKRDGNREQFKAWIDSHPQMRWLKARVHEIVNANIKQVLIEDHAKIYDRFIKSHPRLAPRHQRDISRIVALIKAHALLNCFQRESPKSDVIVANDEDIEAGFWLYGLVAKPNELGLSPQIYEIWESVVKPLLGIFDTGLQRRKILEEYHTVHGRLLTEEKLRREILPALESAGLIHQEKDPNDKRQTLIFRSFLGDESPPNAPPISTNTARPNKIGE
jgi:hypothetical protein